MLLMGSKVSLSALKTEQVGEREREREGGEIDFQVWTVLTSLEGQYNKNYEAQIFRRYTRRRSFEAVNWEKHTGPHLGTQETFSVLANSL